MPASWSPRASRVAIAVILVSCVGLGWWIGSEVSQRRSENELRERIARLRAQTQAEARKEREDIRKERAAERKQQVAESIDDKLEAANRNALRAARAGRRRDVARAESELHAIAARLAPNADSGSRDPFERELDRFPIKLPPLLAQQIMSGDGEHVLFVLVSRPYLCLKPPQDRARAVRQVYGPMQRRLRREGIRDFEMLVTPFTARAPTRSQALATGAHQRVVLTSRGRAC